MEAIVSELILADFGVLECDYSFIVRDEDADSLFSIETFREYPIDIDYDINELDGLLRVFMVIKVNTSSQPLNGYSITVKAAGLYKFKEDTVEEEKNSLMPSAISITINNIRGFITSLTGVCPYGRFILPAIDLGDIINKKNKLLHEASVKEPSKKKKTPRKKIK